MGVNIGDFLKPSPYFADTFRFFLKRFSSQQSLFNWFIKQAGDFTAPFEFPEILKDHPKTLVFLPREMERCTAFLHAMPDAWFKNVHFFAHESLHALISAKRSHAFYYSDRECRFGEAVFNELQDKIQTYTPEVCIYLGDKFLPRLFLAKTSGAACRIGFDVSDVYPFLNISLQKNESSEAALIAKYYGVSK
ncbi:MAG: hypothetical protein HUK21_08140 [Fibrobacteraceae bacterium]|nr:hypothetical protein [Fibrobacteraceae bacterium]